MRLRMRCSPATASSHQSSDISSLDFAFLDAEIERGLIKVATDWNALLPYLLEMNMRLSAPGKRTDLRKGAPADLSWTAWVDSKRQKLGRSLRSIQYMLKGKTAASKARQMLAQGRAELGCDPNRSAMDVASEMASVVLHLWQDTDDPADEFKNEHAASDWLTPPQLVKRLGNFDVDPCACPGMPWKLAHKVYTPPEDGLSLPWGEGRSSRVWLNPPYGAHVGNWARRMAAHGNGIMLLFGRTETQAWQEHIWPRADAILFPIGRVHFCLPDGNRALSGTAPSSLIAYGRNNVEALLKSGIAGALVPKAEMLQGTRGTATLKW